MNEKITRAGEVALIGRPNVGKSSIVNALLGCKVAAVSHVAQTTRDSVRAVVNTGSSQIVLVDTPGIHKPRHELGNYMMRQVSGALRDVCGICYVVEATDMKLSSLDRRIIQHIEEAGRPAALIINKIDCLKSPEGLWRAVEAYQGAFAFEEIIPMSAVKGSNMDVLLSRMVSWLPERDEIYASDMLIDQTERYLASEIIREKVFLETSQEVPHSVAVVIESFKSPQEHADCTRMSISATLIVEKDGQKGIIIGQGGARILKMRLEAQKELARIFGQRVELELWVKVRPGWRKSEAGLRSVGYGR